MHRSRRLCVALRDSETAWHAPHCGVDCGPVALRYPTPLRCPPIRRRPAIVLRHPDLRRYLSGALHRRPWPPRSRPWPSAGRCSASSGDPVRPRAWWRSRSSCRSSSSSFRPGHVADRYDRRRVQLLHLRPAGRLRRGAPGTVARRRDRHWLRSSRSWSLFGIARAFNQPTGQALLPNIAPDRSVFPQRGRGQLVAAARSRRSPAGPRRRARPARRRGGLRAGAGAAGRRHRPRRGPARWRATGCAREPVSWATLLSGITFVRSRPIVLGSISLDLFAVLFGGATALLPIYAGEILDVGPAGLGVMRAAPAVGAAVLAAVVTVRPLRRASGGGCSAAWRSSALATIVFGMSTELRAQPGGAGGHGRRRTWSASTSGTCSCSSRRRTRSAAGSAR